MHPKLLRLSAGLCLATQIAGIAVGTLSPVFALAKETPRPLFSSRTVPYVLRAGESVTTVARQHGMSVAELKTLNQFRTFSKPFEQLGSGDELDIPLAKSAEKGSPQTASDSVTTDAENTAFWAGTASMAGSALSSGDTGQAVAGMARSKVTGTAASEAEAWLGKFGTARVDLSVGEGFKLEDSSVDFLYAFYDTPANMLFTQLGYRYKDERSTINLGLGYRTFQGAWMYGANVFYDNDLTGHNKRLGLGLEAWTDYLKLSANSYRGLTDWHQSRDFADYDERPADGFDVRAEGWLPSYPQLGGKLVYEQYRGDEVALFSKDERSKDPKAVTLGVNYTPIPLVTLGLDHRQGEDGQNDTQVNLEFNYRLDMPWSAQTDPAAVDGIRSLAGSRYDLVERNNNIVLEYKKQDLIHLTLPETLTGKAGETATLTATVKAKYGTDRVEWAYGEILAAGGSVEELNRQTLKVTYPPYAPGSTPENNKYHIHAVAYDSQNNASNRSTTEVRVSEPDAAIASGDLTMATDGEVANGSAANIAQARVTDAAHRPVAGVKVVFSANNNAVVETAETVSGADGLATTNLTSKTAGVVSVTATVNASSQSVDSTFIADSASAVIADGNLAVTTDQAKADGSATNTVKATVTDAQGNVVPGAVVSFSVENGATITESEVPANNQGEAVTNLTSTQAGVYNLLAKVNGTNGKTVQVHFTADNSTAVIADDDFEVASGAKADGNETNTVQATVKDAQGNPVPKVNVIFTVTGNAVADNPSVVTGDDGIAKVALTSKVAGDNQVRATVGHYNTPVKISTFVADESSAIIADSDFQVATGAKADGVATNALQATVRDTNNNPVTGADVTFTVTDGEATVVLQKASTGTDGIAKAALTSKVAGDNQVRATVGHYNTPVKISTFVADESSAIIADGALITVKDGAVADDNDTNVVKAKVTDANGNPVKGVDVKFSADNGAKIVKDKVSTDENGEASTMLTSTTAGTAVVTATANASSQTVDTSFIVDAKNTRTTLTADTPKQVADGVSPILLTATVKDINGNPVVGERVLFSNPGASDTAKITDNDVSTDENGVVVVSLTDTTALAYYVMAGLDGQAMGRVDVEFVGDAKTGVATLTSDVEAQPTDGTSLITLTASVKDAFNNPVTDERVNFTTTGSAVFTGDSTAVATDAQGKAVVSLKDAVAETVTTTAMPETNSAGAGTKSLTFTAVPAVPMTASTKIEVNGAKFTAADNFPKTGYDGASFQFAMEGDTANNNNYVWTVESGSWLRVDGSGMVMFNGKGSDAVILATPKTGGTPQKFTIDVNLWFDNIGTGMGNEADTLCAASGYYVPSSAQMTNATLDNNSASRVPSGEFWPEWGQHWTPGSTTLSWISDPSTGNTSRAISDKTGTISTGNNTNPYAVVCVKSI